MARPGGAPSDPAVEHCVSLTEDNPCTRCTCAGCQAQALACGDGANTQRSTQCLAIVECGMTNHCTSVGCYCGTAALDACGANPLGACRAEIQAAAGTTDFAAIATALTTADHAVFLANAVGDCAFTNCRAECGL